LDKAIEDRETVPQPAVETGKEEEAFEPALDHWSLRRGQLGASD
jgi:hypothetical protein